jgi:hypothetical protein
MASRTTALSACSNSSPIMMVVPAWRIVRRSLVIIDPMVKANTRPAVVTTRPHVHQTCRITRHCLGMHMHLVSAYRLAEQGFRS